MVLIFSDSNKLQTYKNPDRESPNHEIEEIMSSNSLNLPKPKKYTEDKNFLFESEDKQHFLREKFQLVLKQMIK